MFNAILQFLSIRCAHRKLSKPFSDSAPIRSSAVNADWDRTGPASHTYVVCLDCGRKFDYDWTNMRVNRKDTGRTQNV